MQRHKICDVPFDIFNISRCIRYKSKKASNAVWFKEIVIAKMKDLGALTWLVIPSMKNIHIVLCRIWPKIKLHHSYTSLQCLYDWHMTTVTAELISSQVWIMSSIYVVMRQWSFHILMNLKIYIAPKMAKIRNCLKLNFTSQWTKIVSDWVDFNIKTEFAVCTEQNILISFPILSQQTNITKEPKYREIDLTSEPKT